MTRNGGPQTGACLILSDNSQRILISNSKRTFASNHAFKVPLLDFDVSVETLMCVRIVGSGEAQTKSSKLLRCLKREAKQRKADSNTKVCACVCVSKVFSTASRKGSRKVHKQSQKVSENP